MSGEIHTVLVDDPAAAAAVMRLGPGKRVALAGTVLGAAGTWVMRLAPDPAMEVYAGGGRVASARFDVDAAEFRSDGTAPADAVALPGGWRITGHRPATAWESAMATPASTRWPRPPPPNGRASAHPLRWPPPARPDPPMPARPPANALKAIETVRGLRSWTAAEMYAAVREACADPAPPAEPPRARPGAPPVQG